MDECRTIEDSDRVMDEWDLETLTEFINACESEQRPTPDLLNAILKEAKWRYDKLVGNMKDPPRSF